MNYLPGNDPRVVKGKVLSRFYKIKTPLIKRSRLTRRNARGTGKDLSDRLSISLLAALTDVPFVALTRKLKGLPVADSPPV